MEREGIQMAAEKSMIGIYINSSKDPEGSVLQYVCSVMDRYHMTYRVIENIHGPLPEKLSLLLVFGGDGTILAAAKRTAGTSIAILGVNIGNLGFLSCSDLNGFDKIAEELARGNGVTESRMMLSASTENSPSQGFSVRALNEFCILRSEDAKMVHLSVSVNEDIVGHFDADGLIISTPTGSTAYSLSAGGPIVYPNANCILITPMCAHSLTARPIIVNGDDKITVRSVSGAIKLAADWQERYTLQQGEVLQIQKADVQTYFCNIGTYQLFDRMREKFLL